MKTIGLLGGMGPLATVDLFEKIVLWTKAQKDQDHIPILVYNNSQVPDRTQAILYGEESPYRDLVESALKLKRMGADFLVIACNTSHYYYDDLVQEVGLPILHMQETAAGAIKRAGLKKPAILATQGALKVGLYQKALDKEGLDYLVPSSQEEEAIQEVIYRGVKEGNFHLSQDRIKAVFHSLEDKGADSMILGCTELPIARRVFHWQGTFIDPSLELAKRAIIYAGGSLKDGPMETI